MYNDGTANVLYSTFSNDTAAYGGGVYSGSGSLNMTGCTISADSAKYSGGGLYSYTETANLAGCTFTGDMAGPGYDGGGLYAGDQAFIDAGTVNAYDCTFSGNKASVGGGVYVQVAWCC